MGNKNARTPYQSRLVEENQQELPLNADSKTDMIVSLATQAIENYEIHNEVESKTDSVAMNSLIYGNKKNQNKAESKEDEACKSVQSDNQTNKTAQIKSNSTCHKQNNNNSNKSERNSIKFIIKKYDEDMVEAFDEDDKSCSSRSPSQSSSISLFTRRNKSMSGEVFEQESESISYLDRMASKLNTKSTSQNSDLVEVDDEIK